MTSSDPKWTLGLKRTSCGLYFEGVVDDLAVTLESHKQATVSTFGTRTSYRAGKPSDDKENQKVSY